MEEKRNQDPCILSYNGGLESLHISDIMFILGFVSRKQIDFGGPNEQRWRKRDFLD